MSIESALSSGHSFFVGAAQFILVIAITEAVSWVFRGDYLPQRFGCATNALLFNPSVAVLGVCVFIGSLIGRRTLGRGLTITLAVTGACAVGMGRFPETTGAPHIVFSIAIFVFGAVSATSRVGYCARCSRTSQWASGSSRSLPLS